MRYLSSPSSPPLSLSPGDLLASALLLGISNDPTRNIFNAKALSGTKVTVVMAAGTEAGLVASCEGGLTLAGALLGNSPVLVGVNQCSGAVVRLEGGVVIVSGRSLKDLLQEVKEVQEVRERVYVCVCVCVCVCVFPSCTSYFIQRCLFSVHLHWP